MLYYNVGGINVCWLCIVKRCPLLCYFFFSSNCVGVTTVYYDSHSGIALVSYFAHTDVSALDKPVDGFEIMSFIM